MPSTVVGHINYDPERMTLKIRFVSGLVYEYQKVPPEVYAEMKNARSKGTYLNQHIKNNFEFKKVE